MPYRVGPPRTPLRGAFVDYDDYGRPAMTANEVIQGGREPIDTGLIDASGQTIYRTPETVPFGFVKA